MHGWAVDYRRWRGARFLFARKRLPAALERDQSLVIRSVDARMRTSPSSSVRKLMYVPPVENERIRYQAVRAHSMFGASCAGSSHEAMMFSIEPASRLPTAE